MAGRRGNIKNTAREFCLAVCNLTKLHLSMSQSWLTPDYLFFLRKSLEGNSTESFSINGLRLSINQASLMFCIRLAPLVFQHQWAASQHKSSKLDVLHSTCTIGLGVFLLLNSSNSVEINRVGKTDKSLSAAYVPLLLSNINRTNGTATMSSKK